MDRKDKGKRKIIQPVQSKHSTSSEEDNKSTGSKLMQSAINSQIIQAEKTYSYPQYNPIMDPKFLNKFDPSKVKQWKASSSNNTQKQWKTSSSNTQTDSVITFGNFVLQKCYDMNRKFRPLIGVELTEQQQCLLDNLWHISTLPQASNFKVQVLNALSVYFSEHKQTVITQQPRRFSHYVVFRGTKVGIFNKWDTMRKYIQIKNPIFKGYENFADASRAAREAFGINDYFIEPEEVKTFSDIARMNPEQVIKAQEEMIANLQQQLIQSGKDQQFTHIQIENTMLKQQNSILEEKLLKLQTQLEKRESETNTAVYRDFNSFKARIIDIPWRQTMQPILDRIPELDNIISQKICTEFPLILYELQQQIIDIAFSENKYKGVTVVQRTYNNQPIYNRLLLQIDLREESLTSEQILNFYHNGMIDYLEFSFNPKTEALFNKFGEKFVITAGNIASFSEGLIGCKIFSSFPEVDSYTYRPARKRIFISHRSEEQRQLKKTACTKDLCFGQEKDEDMTTFIRLGQQTPTLPITFQWIEYKLLAEGHYLQIWSHYNWDMYLPFMGEGHICPIDINNREYVENDNGDNTPISPVSIDSTHRDF